MYVSTSTFLASFRGRGMYRFGPLDSLDSAGVFWGNLDRFMV